MALPTVASVVSSGLASFPTVFYDRVAVATLRSNLALYGALDLKTMPDRSGVTMQIFDHSKMGANVSAVTEGTPFAGQAVTQNTRSISLVQYADYISISDKVAKTALIDQGKANAELLGYRGALSVDNLINAVLQTARTADATTQINLSTAATYVTASVIRQAVFGLRAIDTPAKSNGLYYGVIHSLIAFDLLNDASAGGFQDIWKYTDANKAASNQITSEFSGTANRVATIAGCELFESNNVQSTANYVTTHTGYDTYIFGRNAIFGASLGKTQLGEKNFSVQMSDFAQGSNSLDPAGLIKGAVSYNFFFGAAVRPGAVNGFRVIRAASSLS